MSDTSDSTVTRKPVVLSSDVPSQDDKPKLTEAQMINLLAKRLKPSAVTRRAFYGNQTHGDIIQGTWQGYKNASSTIAAGAGINMPGQDAAKMPAGAQAELARRMLEHLPEEMWTDEIANHADIRSLLQRVLASEQGAVEDRSEIAQLAGFVMVDENARIATELRKITERTDLSDGSGIGLSIQDNSDALVQSYLDDAREGRIALLPSTNDATAIQIDPRTGKPRSNDRNLNSRLEAENPFAAFINGGATGAARYSYLTKAELDEMLMRSNDVSGSIDQLMSIEQEFGSLAEAGVDENGQPVSIGGRPVGVNYDDEMTQRIYGVAPGLNGRPDDPGRGPTQVDVNKTYTMTETLGLPKSMTSNEVLALSKQMEAAGLYELVGGKPLYPGRATDYKFKAAWKLLMGSAVEDGVSMMEWLKQRKDAYEDSVTERLSSRLTDPARVRLNADLVGQSLLGRKLTGAEQAQMQQFVHGLEMRNAKLEAGLSIDGQVDQENGLDINIMADIDARMQEAVRRNSPVEAGAKDVADTYDDFSRLLAGPGRGGAF
jgi:hypothetical protein